MPRSFTAASFVEDEFEEGEADPMSGLANLADVMLVFACGLMMALVVYWNLDLPSLVEFDATSMQEVDQTEEITEEITSSGTAYQEMGTAYRDPATGKVYVMAPVEVEGAEAENAGEAEGVAGETAEADVEAEVEGGSVVREVVEAEAEGAGGA